MAGCGRQNNILQRSPHSNPQVYEYVIITYEYVILRGKGDLADLVG